MSTLKRWTDYGGMIACEDGEFTSYYAAKALEVERDALREVLTALLQEHDLAPDAWDAARKLYIHNQEDKMNLDLSKPVRLKGMKLQFFPTSAIDDVGRIVGVVQDGNQMFVARYAESELENIPELVKRIVYILVEESGSISIAVPPELPLPMGRRIICWRDEEGKTRVESRE